MIRHICIFGLLENSSYQFAYTANVGSVQVLTYSGSSTPQPTVKTVYMNCSTGRMNVTGDSRASDLLGVKGTSLYPLGLFGYNDGSSSGNFNSLCKITKVEISEGNTLVRNFVPCTVNGVGAIIDTISGNIFYNKGSGNFGVG